MLFPRRINPYYYSIHCSMCQIININRGEKEITTPREFEAHFGYPPLLNGEVQDARHLDLCLCNYDLDAVFKEKGIEYGICDFGDYYVGDLDNCKLNYRYKPNGNEVTALWIEDATEITPGLFEERWEITRK